MAQLPTNRTTTNSDAEHVADHNELHTQHNKWDSLAGLPAVTVASGDIIVVEDISNSNTKGYTTAQEIADLGVAGGDGTAYHSDVSGEIHATTAVASLSATDELVIEDADASWVKKRVAVSAINALVIHNDTAAIHDNVASEISALTSVTPATGDLLLIEDISDSNNKKRVTTQAVADLAPDTNTVLLTLSEAGTLATGTGVSRLPLPFAATIVNVRAMVNTAPTGTSLIVDVNKNGTTIFTGGTNRPTIAVSGTDSGNKTPAVTALVAGDYLTVDVDQVGSTVAGADLVVAIELAVS